MTKEPKIVHWVNNAEDMKGIEPGVYVMQIEDAAELVHKDGTPIICLELKYIAGRNVDVE